MNMVARMIEEAKIRDPMRIPFFFSKHGRCVCPVQSGYHAGEDIVSGHYCGTKVLSVGPQRGYDQEDRHACKEENTGAVVILFIFEEKVDDHCRYIGKP